MRILVALDQGTTSSRAIVFDERDTRLPRMPSSSSSTIPGPRGWRHDPDDILGTQVEALQKP